MYLKDGAIAAAGAVLLFLIAGYATGGLLFYIALILSLTFAVADYARLCLMRADSGKISVARSLSRVELPPGLSAALTAKLAYAGDRALKISVFQPLDRSIRSDMGLRQLILARGSITTLSAGITPSGYGEYAISPMKAVIDSWLFRDVVPIGGIDDLTLRVVIGTSSNRQNATIRSNTRYSYLFDSFPGQSGGSDFSGVRHYVAGDSTKNIDWAMSGKTGSLIVRQYEEERTLPVCFLIDVDASMGMGARTELESAVGMAAPAIDRLLIDNERVGLACFSRDDIVSYAHMGTGRDHVAGLKAILTSVKPVASSGAGPLPSVSAQELRQAGREFDNTGILGTVIGETLKGYMANIRHDGFSRAILKVSQSTTTACHIVVMTNLSMGLTSLLNGIRMANYYGHQVSVVFTPHIWHEDKELIDVGRYYEEYMSVKDTIMKLRGSSVKVIDLSSVEKPEDVIYTSRIRSRQTGIRG
jgi:hypothetical protein